MLMKQLSKNKLHGKFWTGKTSIKEDIEVRKLEDLSDADKAYFNYISQVDEIPTNFENEIWETINKIKTRPQKILIRWSIAATILIIIGLASVFSIHQRKLKLEEQFAIIEQTMHHVSFELTNSRSTDILYKDDFIVIVAEN